MLQESLLKVESLTAFTDTTNLLENVSFALDCGETLCVVGESGAGKSTLLKSLLGIQPSHWKRFQHHLVNGDIEIINVEKRTLGLPFTQWVAQDPLAALNPRLNLNDLISETLYKQNLPKGERADKVMHALASVDLPTDWLQRKPTELSIGQAQRVCIARAIICEPKLILFDEPLSALDAITQKQVAETMHTIHQETQYAQIIVTHDLGFAKAYADKILVLKNGQVDAYASASDFFTTDQTEYCHKLLTAAQKLGVLY
ncbi:ABC transporter ATP-binding protein [Curvivirga sp.]|uniref:ABC transporter ATP-binding protein n=1 Tax=Curvivirga sp. TaxID=2856848 RepID=UPI003B5C4567